MDPFRDESSVLVEHLVVDAGGFIKHVEIQKIGQKIYSLPEIIGEIKDKNTKERLAVLPYEIIFREPSAELIVTVSDFAKKTGDYASLSATDIKVIALTLLLEKEHVGTDHLRKEPAKSKTLVHTFVKDPQSTIPGFFMPKTEDTGHATLSSLSHSEPDHQVETDGGGSENPDKDSEDVRPEMRRSADDVTESLQTLDIGLSCDSAKKDAQDGPLIDSADWEEEKEVTDLCTTARDNEDDADVGWITPHNIKEVYKKLGYKPQEQKHAAPKVACLSMDFSIQNVLKQMGMHVIAADGMEIKSLRTYALRCFGCFKVSHNMSKKFCPSCGNATLKRVCMTVGQDGQTKYHISTKRPINIRGTKFSLPLPKGGKHAVNPILFEDQPQPHFCAAKKSLQKLNVFDPDYVTRDSPFMLNDLTSRASQLGKRGKTDFTEMQPWMAKNPNAVRRPRK